MSFFWVLTRGICSQFEWEWANKAPSNSTFNGGNSGNLPAYFHEMAEGVCAIAVAAMQSKATDKLACRPTLEHDDGNQNKHYHDDSGGEGDGENHFVIHNSQMYYWLFAISIAKLRTSSETDVSLEEKDVSNQEKLLFSPFHRGKARLNLAILRSAISVTTRQTSSKLSLHSLLAEIHWASCRRRYGKVGRGWRDWECRKVRRRWQWGR